MDSGWNKLSCGSRAVYINVKKQSVTMQLPPGALLKSEEESFPGNAFEGAVDLATQTDCGKLSAPSLECLNAVVRAIWSLVTENTNKQALVAASGIEALIAAMSAHPDDAELQSDAVTTLWLLLMHPKKKHEKVRFRAAGGIEQVIAAMRSHPLDVSVQEACCGALQALALGDTPSHEPIRDCGGIEAMTAALLEHCWSTAPTGADLSSNGGEDGSSRGSAYTTASSKLYQYAAFAMEHLEMELGLLKMGLPPHENLQVTE